MRALSKVILMQKKFTRLERELLSPSEGCSPCCFKIIDFSPEETRVENGKTFVYPATIEVKFENWSNSFYSVRVSDCRWIASGRDLSGPGQSGFEVLRDQLRELKDFEAHRKTLAARREVAV